MRYRGLYAFVLAPRRACYALVCDEEGRVIEHEYLYMNIFNSC